MFYEQEKRRRGCYKVGRQLCLPEFPVYHCDRPFISFSVGQPQESNAEASRDKLWREEFYLFLTVTVKGKKCMLLTNIYNHFHHFIWPSQQF
jgi:hypothetical protein